MIDRRPFLGEVAVHRHGPGMGECAPCKAMRLQREAQEEMKRRYPLRDTNLSGKKLGCCGYDELSYKPPTTRPLLFGRPIIPSNL